MGQHTKAVGTVGIAVVAVVLAAAVPGVAGGQTTGIEECRTIDQSGTYELSGTIDGSDADTCLRISADDVVLRGNGETVDGGDASQGTTGIAVDGDAVAIRNVVVSGWGTGIAADGAADGTVAGVTATDNVASVDLRGTDGFTVEGLEARSNERWGLALRQGASGTTVRGGTLTDNDRDLYVRAGGGNAVRSVSLGRSTAPDTRFSASMLRDVTLKGVDLLPAAPEGGESIDRGIAISPLSNNAGLSLEMHYADGDVEGVDESTVAIWSHDEESWAELGGSADTDEDTATAPLDVSDFRARTTTFAVLARSSDSGSQTATATATDTPTRTPVPPTPTATPTRTPVPSTETPTRTPIPSTETPTRTPVPSTATRTPVPTDTVADGGGESAGGAGSAGDGERERTATAANGSVRADEPTETTASGGAAAADTEEGTSSGQSGGSAGGVAGLPTAPLLLPVGLLVSLVGLSAVGVVLCRTEAFDEVLSSSAASETTAASDEDDEATGDAVRGVRDLTNCPDCGGIVGTNEQFCTHCGTAIGDATSAPDQTGASAVPTSVTLSIGGREIGVDDGTTVDEELRSLLRDGGRADQAKWIDDDHLTFHRSADGFVLETEGENLTRLNGDRLRPGERRPVEPGDEIEVSGFLRLSVEE